MSAVLITALGASLAIVAFVASILGIGGGVLYTPLQLLFGLNIHEAATTSLFLIVILSISATSVYRRAGKVDWGMAGMLEIFTVAGGFCGGYVSNYLPQALLIAMLAATLIFAGGSMIRTRSAAAGGHSAKNAWYLWKRNACGEAYELNLFLALPISFIAGMLSGMLGIGGGVIKVPMMVLLFGIPMDIAVATSGFMVGITALGGFAGHVMAGHWDWRTGLFLAPGVFIGAMLGAHVMLRTKKARLKRAFGAFLLLIAAALIARLIF